MKTYARTAKYAVGFSRTLWGVGMQACMFDGHYHSRWTADMWTEVFGLSSGGRNAWSRHDHDLESIWIHR